MDFDKDPTLQEWTREQPLAVLALDSADRAVLRIADLNEVHYIYSTKEHQLTIYFSVLEMLMCWQIVFVAKTSESNVIGQNGFMDLSIHALVVFMSFFNMVFGCYTF
ncbi:hypothetical protein GWI33_001512 [Rhynchophorus ferrugineus]|uniref:Uncharacterized protein n=1 Tax=Rhynchophorus ferrugineus TaxID=354439 RepID=A0A834IQF4_RHYFE|nr:hypothetical protein GWI33_001512 [Rhynchophorus ferrugineus]